MQNPFEHQLRAHRPGRMTALAMESPLPLGQRSSDVSTIDDARFFDYDLGDLQIIAASGSGRRQQLMARPWISLLYVIRGEIVIVQSGRQVSGNAGGCVLIPEAPALWRSQAFSVVCLMLHPQRLAELIHATVQGKEGVRHCASDNLKTHDFRRERDLREQQLLELLAVNLRALAAFQTHDPRLIESLSLADQLARITAALVATSVADQPWREPQQRRGSAGMQETLDDLIAFIEANLDQPLNLSMLENRTHYSKRALQYAFRQRLGCTASQWIRAQRLDRAYRLLQQAEASDSVSRIASRCGYHSISLFSIDFQQRFHIKHSHLLRQWRQPS